MSYLIIRSEEWAGLYSLQLSAEREHIKRHCQGARQSEEPIGDAWLIDTEGEPVRLMVQSSMTPYNEDDYATLTVKFIDPRNGRAVAEVSFRMDGRS